MIYIKSIFTGIVVLFLAAVLFTVGGTIYVAIRYPWGFFLESPRLSELLLTAPVVGLIFSSGFVWKLRRLSRRVSSPR
jgi:hypothetical protein